jgi:hypothetical protein
VFPRLDRVYRRLRAITGYPEIAPAGDAASELQGRGAT